MLRDGLDSTNASLIIEAMGAMARGEDISFVGGMESVKMNVRTMIGIAIGKRQLAY